MTWDSTETYIQKEMILPVTRNDRVHGISQLSFASVFTSFHGETILLLRKKSTKNQLARVHDSIARGSLLGKWENGTEKGTWNGSRSVIRASAAKIITFAGSDSLRRPIYYFIRLSVVTQGQAKISLSPSLSKGTTSVDLLRRACDTRIYHQVDQPVGAALLWHKACHFRPERRRVRISIVHFLQKFLSSKRNAWSFHRLKRLRLLFHESNYIPIIDRDVKNSSIVIRLI